MATGLVFLPWSSDEDVRYLRINGDEPRYFVQQSNDEDESYLRVNGDGPRFFYRGQVTRMSAP